MEIEHEIAEAKLADEIAEAKLADAIAEVKLARKEEALADNEIAETKLVTAEIKLAMKEEEAMEKLAMKGKAIKKLAMKELEKLAMEKLAMKEEAAKKNKEEDEVEVMKEEEAMEKLAMKEEAIKMLAMKEMEKLAMEKLAMKEEAAKKNKEEDEVEVKFPPFITDEIKKKSPPGFWENWFKEEAKLAKKKLKKKLNRAKSHSDVLAPKEEEKESVLTPEQEEKDSVLTPEQEKQSETVTFRNKDPGFESDMERYNYDMNRSDGFDVGKYPHMFGSVNYSANRVSCYYNPQINQALPRSRLDTLLCLSNLAISLYNMHQCPPTYYDSVKVLKAMRFGVNSYNNYNLTFQAKLPAQLPVTFQTKVKTQKMSKFFEIVFVRKVKGGDDDDQEIDFMWGEKNVSQEIDDDEIGTQICSPYTDSGFKLSLPLSQLALHMFHENTNSSYELRYELQTVNVLETKKSVMSTQEGATYLITFEAFWPRMGFEIFQTEIHLSPLVPPVSIRIKSVKIFPPPPCACWFIDKNQQAQDSNLQSSDHESDESSDHRALVWYYPS